MPLLPDDHAMNIAALGGAAAGTLANRSSDGVGRKLAEGLVGACVGIWWGPAIADMLRAEGDHLRTGVAFGIGLCGLLICTAVIDAAKGFSLKEWLARFINSRIPPAR